MEFKNNWVYPFPDTMYDPVLKVRVSITHGHETYTGDVPFAIYYDPEIEPDHLTVPVTEETKAFWRSRPQDQHKAEDDSIRWPFVSDKDVQIGIREYCSWTCMGDVVRLKISIKSEYLPNIRKIINSLSIPIISDDPLAFLIYVYKNYIALSALSDEYYDKKSCPDSRRAEICLNADAFLNGFGLSPTDYAEVEPGWYCLASKELAR